MIDAIDGFMSDEEMTWLNERARTVDSIVEVGCWKGRSTFALLTGCVRGRVYAVDHWLGSPSERDTNHREAVEGDVFEIFVNNVGLFANLEIVRAESSEAATRFADRSIDMIFLDGDHEFEAVARDIAVWLPKCRTLFCGHDRMFDGVAQAIFEAGLEVYAGPGSIWYVKVN